MHENTLGRLTFLVKSMFRRLDKFDGPISQGGGEGGRGAYIQGEVLTWFYSIFR